MPVGALHRTVIASHGDHDPTRLPAKRTSAASPATNAICRSEHSPATQPRRLRLAYVDSRPIAGAAMYAGEDAAWCGLAATLQAERGRGALSALFVRRIQDAATAGCRWVTAETLPERPDRSNPSLRNMRRLGFEELYEREAHVYGLPAIAVT